MRKKEGGESYKMAKTAVFGGSFDPPHLGHTQLILSLKEAHGIDKVLIIPAQLNPLKPSAASPEHRLHMSHLAFDDVPGCTVLDLELSQSSPSYTVDTLRWLMEHHEAFQRSERFLLLGADVIPSLLQWKEVDTVFSIARPLFAARVGIDGRQLAGLTPFVLQAVHDGWTQTGLFDISSTGVRDRLRQGLYIDHLVKESVIRYIHSVKIYMH
jgi:nicotinate-nucleotide adenylyltransferase